MKIIVYVLIYVQYLHTVTVIFDPKRLPILFYEDHSFNFSTYYVVWQIIELLSGSLLTTQPTVWFSIPRPFSFEDASACLRMHRHTYGYRDICLCRDAQGSFAEPSCPWASGLSDCTKQNQNYVLKFESQIYLSTRYYQFLPKLSVYIFDTSIYLGKFMDENYHLIVQIFYTFIIVNNMKYCFCF